MPRKPDNGLRAKLHEKTPRIHWQGVELGLLWPGVPDSNGCLEGSEFWVESKYTDTDAVTFQPMQPGWILRRMRAGGRVFILVWKEHDGGPRRGPAISELHLFEGWDVVQLRDEGMGGVPPVLSMSGGPSRWDWGLLERVLVEWTFGRR